MDIMYSLDEIGLIPATTSYIKSRKDVDPYYYNSMQKLPVFVAPMTCLIDEGNFSWFDCSKFIPIFPVWHNNEFHICDTWSACTLNTFKKLVNTYKVINVTGKVLIDTANANMDELINIVAAAKIMSPNLEIMVGNIASPQTFKKLSDAGANYIRVGIGGGSGCTTSVLTGFHASLPWLITEIKKMNLPAKIVADGGIDTIDKAIKCLALGADYVMMGRIFANCKESRTNTTKLYYGQSSNLGQIDRFGEVKSSPEGISYPIIPINTLLEELEETFTAALRSAMSYASAQTLFDFIGKVEYRIQSINEFNSYYKK